MPAKTRKQQRFMAACSTPKGRKNIGSKCPPKKVAEKYKTLERKTGGKANDACAKKVKKRYKVWPSAYASGAVAKCRKVGAKNWGNKSKKSDSKK